MKNKFVKCGDKVIYCGRKWFWYSIHNEKAYIVLLPGEKKIERGLREYDSILTNPKNLKPINYKNIKK